MEIILILHNIRSIHNVGSIFRTAEGFGVKQIYLTGYTPSPDNGLSHVRVRIAEQLRKTALGAENFIKFDYNNDINNLIDSLRKKGYRIVGLEQDPRAMPLPDYSNNRYHSKKIALLLGEEVNGITPELRQQCDDLIEIPMRGRKESFNVSVATGVALYGLLFSRIDSGSGPE